MKIKNLSGNVCVLTLRPVFTRMCMLVWLLRAAFSPPLFGVGGRSKQLRGGSRGSGGGAAFCLKHKDTRCYFNRTIGHYFLVGARLCPWVSERQRETYLLLLVMSGRLWLTRPWLSSRMDWGVMLGFRRSPATTLLKTLCARRDTFRLAVFSKIYQSCTSIVIGNACGQRFSILSTNNWLATYHFERKDELRDPLLAAELSQKLIRVWALAVTGLHHFWNNTLDFLFLRKRAKQLIVENLRKILYISYCTLPT